jgi:hypothetical protein
MSRTHRRPTPIDPATRNSRQSSATRGRAEQRSRHVTLAFWPTNQNTRHFPPRTIQTQQSDSSKKMLVDKNFLKKFVKNFEWQKVKRFSLKVKTRLEISLHRSDTNRAG